MSLISQKRYVVIKMLNTTKVLMITKVSNIAFLIKTTLVILIN